LGYGWQAIPVLSWRSRRRLPRRSPQGEDGLKRNGDFKQVHRCGVGSAESRAGHHGRDDIEDAAAHSHGMIDARLAADKLRHHHDRARRD
jgi:hypothetical protein